jgi:ubiquinone/menaquinone biosynthesis C-methylase UbiE
MASSEPRIVWTRIRRTQVTQELLRRHARDGISVLDAGSRDAESMKFLPDYCRQGRLVALDWHNTVQGNIEFIKCDLEQTLPFADRSFDFVICNDVIEHVERKNHLLVELCRVAREHLVICLPNTQNLEYIVGLARGKMSGNYRFNIEDDQDRHRWVTYFKANNKFIQRAEQFELQEMYHIVKRGFMNDLGRLLRSKFVVFNQLYFLRRRFP